MTTWKPSHLEIVAKMVRAKVTGKHHKQADTIKGWANLDGNVFDSALDDLISDPEGPVQQKGRGTIQLTSISDGKDFIEKYDNEGDYSWYL